MLSGVRMSRGLDLNGALDASGRVLNVSGRTATNASGLGDALESDVDDDDAEDDGMLQRGEGENGDVRDMQGAEESDDEEFLHDALSEQTVVIDPRSSLRASRSVGHLLQQQVAILVSFSSGVCTYVCACVVGNADAHA